MKKNGKIFFFLFVLFLQNIFSENYYLDSQNGNNNNSGTAPTVAWKTISKLQEININPGDSILFKRGGVWREELTINSKGTKSNPIVIGAYGKGKNPIIKGSVNATKWRKYSSIIWQTNLSEEPEWIWLIDDNGTIHWGDKKENVKHLVRNYDFVWQDSVLYLYLGKNPSKTFPVVECSLRDFGIISNLDRHDIDYITIENLEISFVKDAGVRAIGSKGWVVKNCIIHHNGAIDESNGQGIQYEGTNGLFTGNQLYENGQHGFFLSSFGNSNVENNVIEKNRVFNNYHTGIDLMNDGGNENSHKNTIIRFNLVYETNDFKGLEVGIQTLGYGNGLVKNVTIHHNVVVHINGIGISAVPNSDSIFIHNNTVYETESSCINVDNGNYYAEVYNNIGINHIYYAPFFLENSKNKKVDFNIWNTDQESFIFIDGEYPETWEGYVSKYGFDKNGSNKQLNIHLEGLIPKVGANVISIDRGKELNYKKDFLGKSINNKLDIGAIEYR